MVTGSMGKESACDAGDEGDKGSVPGSRKSGEGNGNPFQVQSIESQRVGHKLVNIHTHTLKNNPKKNMIWDFPVVKTAALPKQGAWVRSLVRELDPMCHNNKMS